MADFCLTYKFCPINKLSAYRLEPTFSGIAINRIGYLIGFASSVLAVYASQLIKPCVRLSHASPSRRLSAYLRWLHILPVRVYAVLG